MTSVGARNSQLNGNKEIKALDSNKEIKAVDKGRMQKGACLSQRYLLHNQAATRSQNTRASTSNHEA